MMYRYKCPKCHAYIERAIKMDDYDKVKDQQRCSSCGSLLQRIIEFDGLINSPGYGIDKDRGGNGWHAN